MAHTKHHVSVASIVTVSVIFIAAIVIGPLCTCYSCRNYELRIMNFIYYLYSIKHVGQPSGKNVKPHRTCNTRINSRWVMDLIVLVIKNYSVKDNVFA